MREIVPVLQANYCGTVGLEYMHINDLEERRFLQDRMEGKDAAISFTPEGKQSILAKVIQGEQWEKFLAKKYVGTKRFGLDGGESDDPGAGSDHQIWRPDGVREIIFGMAHRGRLNVLANVMGKPYRAIFHEFAGGAPTRRTSAARATSNITSAPRPTASSTAIKVHMSPGPQSQSHLEAVDPVVLGKVRAQQTSAATSEGDTVLPVLLHGDAAFAGQGIVAECFGFSGLPGYGTGGTIHFVINNQVGFTTWPQFARSSPYPSDIAKVGPGADPARQRRRSRSGDLRLQAGDRISPGVQPRHRHRHVVLSPLRPQRGRRAELHPAADVRGDPQASADQRRSTARG